MITYGPDYGKLAVIVEIIDHGRVCCYDDVVMLCCYAMHLLLMHVLLMLVLL